MTRNEFFKDIENKINPIYLFMGEEDYIKTKACEKLMHIVPEGEPVDGVNYVRLDGKTTTADEIYAQCITPSFLGGRKLVIVENYPHILQGAKAKEDGLEQLLDYCTQPYEDTVLLFLTVGDIDKKGKLYKALLKHIIVDFTPMTQKELISWVKRELKLYNKEISDEDILFMTGYTDCHLEALSRELNKLANYVGTSTVSIEDIRAVMTPSRDYNLYKLSNYIFEKKADLALSLCAQLLANKEEPVYVISIAARQFRLALFIKQLLQAGKSGAEIEQQLDIKSFVLAQLKGYAQRYTEAQLRKGLEELLALDEGIKTGLQRPEIGLTTVIVKLCKL